MITKTLALINKRVLVITLATALLFGISITPSRVNAASGSVAIGAPESVVANANFEATVSTSIDVEVNMIIIHVAFDSSTLQFVSVDTSGNAYTSDMPGEDGPAVGSGFVKIARYSAGHVTTGQNVAKITFKALKAGTTALSVTKASSALLHIDNNGVESDVLTSVGSATITVTKVPAVAPATAPSSGSTAVIDPSNNLISAPTVTPETSLTPDSGIAEVTPTEQPESEGVNETHEHGSPLSHDHDEEESKRNLYLISAGTTAAVVGACAWLYSTKYLPKRRLAGKVNKISHIPGSESVEDSQASANLISLDKIRADIPRPDTLINPDSSISKPKDN